MKPGDGSSRPSLKNVADKAGVSVTSASRVLSRSKRVSPELVDRVEAAASELGYSPHGIARGLRTSKTSTVGLIIPDITNPFFAEVSLAIEKSLAQSQYMCMLCNSIEDVQWERRYLQSLI